MGGMRNAQAAEILNRWCASGKDWQTRAALPTSLLFSKNKPRWGRR
jgi:transposase